MEGMEPGRKQHALYNKESLNKKVSFVLYNHNRQTIFSTTITSGRAEFDFNYLPRNLYSYRIIDGEQNMAGKLILGNQ